MLMSDKIGLGLTAKSVAASSQPLLWPRHSTQSCMDCRHASTITFCRCFLVIPSRAAMVYRLPLKCVLACLQSGPRLVLRHGLPTRVHYHVLQMFSCHSIQGCNGVQGASKMCFGLPAVRAQTNFEGCLSVSRDIIANNLRLSKCVQSS